MILIKKVVNLSKNTILGEKVKLADTFGSRFLGLMFRKTLNEGEGLIVKPCNSIHMFFMQFPLDIIFVDKNNTVIYLIEGIRPWKISKIVRYSKYVIELPAGTISKTKTEVGDKIEIN